MSHADPSEADRIEPQARMPALGNVLVATDFGAHGRIAIERAASLPFCLGGRLEIVHVATSESDEIRQRLEEEREQLIRDFTNATVDMPGSIRWRPSVLLGDPSAWILEASRQRNCDVIAVGSGDKGLVRRALLGSVAERIIHEAACDVLVARLPEA